MKKQKTIDVLCKVGKAMADLSDAERFHLLLSMLEAEGVLAGLPRCLFVWQGDSGYSFFAGVRGTTPDEVVHRLRTALEAAEKGIKEGEFRGEQPIQ